MKKTPTNRSEAQSLLAKCQKNIELGSEERLQYEIVKSYRERYPDKHGRLFATFQNPVVQEYGIWIAKGMVEGVSDLLYTDDQRRLVAIEVKHPERPHKRDHVIRQANWIINNAYRGGFCTSVEMFWQMIEGQSNGIDPRLFLENISTHSTIVFKDYLYLLNNLKTK